MDIKTEFTSCEILEALKSEDDFFLFGYAFCCYGYIKYKLTEDENGWLDFVKGRYSIADYIIENTDSDGVTTFYSEEFSKALDDDCHGSGKAVCLSDNTALQAIFFYGYQESEI